MKWRILLLTTLGAVGACVPRSDPPPQQPQQRPTQAAPRPVPLPPPAAQNWRDIPLTPGGWHYSSQPGSSSQASFGPTSSQAYFIIRCDLGRRQVSFSREGVTSGNMMTIRTTSGARNYPLSIQTAPLQYVLGTTSAGDRFLDEIAFTRGRFTIEVPGTTMLVLPSWPEPSRVVEDCRS